jgi:hypothetical protein
VRLNSLPPSAINDEIRGVEFGHASALFTPHRGHDQSSPIDSFYVPTDWMIQRLHLRPETPFRTSFTTQSRETAFVSKLTANSEATVNADLLEPALLSKQLTAVWFLGVEKDAGIRLRNKAAAKDFVSGRFCGLWWREDDNWVGETWLAGR